MSLRSVMVNELNYDIIVREFDLQSFYYVHFMTYSFGRDMNPFLPSKTG